MIGCFTLWELFKKATRSLSRLLPSHLHVQQIVQLCSGKESSFELSPTLPFRHAAAQAPSQ